MDQFHLYVLAMDERTQRILKGIELESATVLYYKDIMAENLGNVLEDRIGPSFFWTFTPIVIEYVLKEQNEQWCTYIDADCYFFRDPVAVFDEIEKGDYSVGIIEHRYRKDADYEKWVSLDGRFNVAFNTFRNEKYSLKILEDWKNQCIDCCTNTPTGENFGDQLYLNEWPDKYDRVYIVEDEGIDVAPWNVNEYRIIKEGDMYRVQKDDKSFELVMYHFHAISFLSNRIVSLNLWNPKKRKESKNLFDIYRDYVLDYRIREKEINCVESYSSDDPIPGNNATKSISFRLGDLVKRLSERREGSIIGVLRNVMIIW